MLTQTPAIPKGKITAPRMGLVNQVQNFEESWSVLKDAINMIFNDRVSELSFERLYSLVYGLILRRNGQKLYECLCELLSKQYSNTRGMLDGLTGIECLKLICEKWGQEQTHLQHISDIFMYMDLVYSKRENKLEVIAMGAQLFLQDIVKPLTSKLTDAMVQELNEARTNTDNYDEFKTLKASVSLFNTLEVKECSSNEFLNVFEPILFQETRSFYKEFLLRMSPMDRNDFRKFKDVLIKEEKILHEIFDDQDAISKIYKVVERVLVSDNMKVLAKSCLPALIECSNTESFLALVTLSSSHSDKEVIFLELADLIRKDLSSIPLDLSIKKRSALSQNWIGMFITKSKKYENLGKSLNVDRSECLKFITEAIGDAINETSYFSEFLSLFMDSYLKTKPLVLNAEIEQCIHFFKLLRDKDTFELFYRQQLSKRLLQEKSTFAVEEQVIALLQEDVGASFTSKLRGMIRDLNTSKAFFNKNGKALISTSEIVVNVLTPMFWPLQNLESNKDITLPNDIEHFKSLFEQSYLKDHSGRLLNWGPHLSTIEVAYRFKNSYHELSMTMFSAMIFLLFKDFETLTFEDIQHKTKIPNQELVKHLMSLSFTQKMRILNKSPPGRPISPTDEFSINYGFSAPERKVRVPMIVSNSRNNTAEHSKASAEKKRQDSRMLLLNSKIVKIMKSERKMNHSDLQSQCTQTISTFQVNSTLFKTSIEYLLRNEYLQRDVEDPTSYHYLP